MALMYCKKCGRIVQGHYNDNCETPCYCDCCKSITYKVPEEYLISKSVPIIKDSAKQQFIEELVKPSPEFDQYLFDHREEILAKQNAEFNQKMAIGNAIRNGAKPEEAFKGNFNVAKCPTCGSTNIEKISLTKKAFGGVMFGLFSSDIRNTMKCKNCGAKW